MSLSFIASKVEDKRTKLKQKSCDFSIKSIFEEDQQWLDFSQSQQDQDERVRGETKDDGNADSVSSNKGGQKRKKWEKIRANLNIFSEDSSAGNQTDHESIKAVVDFRGNDHSPNGDNK